MNRLFPAPLLALFLAVMAAPGCSADQPPAAQRNDAAPAEQATEVVNTVAEQAPAVQTELPAEVPASNEEMPDAAETVLAQAEQATGTTAPAPEPAKPAPFRVGDHYTLLTPAQPTSVAPDKVEIAESFMYGCPHCFSIEPFIEKWLPGKAAYVEFVRIPALFNRPARVHARAYYTAEVLGIIDQTHMPFFREIHVNRKGMTDEDELEAFFAGFGIDEEAFRNAYNSFAVDTKLRRAEALGRRYRISSTPTVVVNGKYVVNGDKVRSYSQILEIADYLAEKEARRE